MSPSARRAFARRCAASSVARPATCRQSTGSPSISHRARSSASSVRTGPARRPPSRCCPGSSTPRRVRPRVLGRVPSRREPEYLRRMTMVMGNRNQLEWDLPARQFVRAQPGDLPPPARPVPRDAGRVVELLDLGDLVGKPVRNLSLGERMKMEIVGALLHRPQVLFLDEPTLGLDVTMQKRIRVVHRRLQRALRGHGPADEPLHGRRPGALQAGHRDPPRPDPVRRRAGVTGPPGSMPARPSA